MGIPIVLADNGIAITEALNGLGIPVTVAANGFGAPVRLVGKGGIPVSGAAIVPVNLLQQSQAFGLWTPIGFTVDPNVSRDPVRNELTADRIVEVAGLTQHNLAPLSITFTSGTTYTFSLYVKYETAAFVQLLFGSAAFGANAWGDFDIQNGTTGTIGSAATGAVEAVGNGWYRISLSAPATASATAPVVIFGADSATMTRALSYTGVVTNTRLFANAQVETGSTANIYVPT